MEFLDLGADCLEDICDRLDIVTLSIIAGTCHKLRDVARRSLVRRNITKFICGQSTTPTKQHHFCTSDASEFVQVLTAFGDLITKMVVNFGKNLADNTIVFNEVVRRCSGTLRWLAYSSFGGWDLDQLVDAEPLFAKLSYLHLEWKNVTPLPLNACQELTTLKIYDLFADDSRAVLSHTFPKLKRFILEFGDVQQAEFDNFIRRHRLLTDIKLWVDVTYGVFTELPHFESISTWFNHDNGVMLLAGLQRLKAIHFNECGYVCEHAGEVIDFINRLAARETLEVLNLEGIFQLLCPESFWKCLAQLRGLRVFKLSAKLADDDLIDGICACIGHWSSIERLELWRYEVGEWQMDKFDRLIALCQQRNIAMALSVRTTEIRQEDLPKLSGRANSFWYTACFGRRE